MTISELKERDRWLGDYWDKHGARRALMASEALFSGSPGWDEDEQEEVEHEHYNPKDKTRRYSAKPQHKEYQREDE